MKNYNILTDGDKLIAKMWNKHVAIEEAALTQIRQTASLPFVKPYVAVMADCHWGMGSTVGSVVPTEDAVCPSITGVDIGCGMMAVRTNLGLHEIEGTKSLQHYFELISRNIPHGRSDNGGAHDIGAWPEDGIPEDIQRIWKREFNRDVNVVTDSGNLFERHPGALSKNAQRHLGTLGTGNHFIEVCTEIDNPDSNLWVVIHSGSRGFGNRIGTYFTKLAGELNRKYHIQLPSKDLGYLVEGTQEYNDYLFAVDLAQKFAWVNREIMMDRVLVALGTEKYNGCVVPCAPAPGTTDAVIAVPTEIHMHHNYMTPFKVGGKWVNLTRKGAVDASLGKWCIIPGSMGQKTAIARGLGNPDSFCSCSHGAGRAMSRTEALKRFTIADHEKATEGVFCDKTQGTLDETPSAYKPIENVMKSQEDLVEAILYIKQLVCIKGISE